MISYSVQNLKYVYHVLSIAILFFFINNKHFHFLFFYIFITPSKNSLIDFFVIIRIQRIVTQRIIHSYCSINLKIGKKVKKL